MSKAMASASPIDGIDPTHDVLRLDRDSLRVFFSPRTVAVIGATERIGSVGRAVFWNLISSPFGGTVYPVNLHRKQVLGVRACATLNELPEPVELAVIVAPAPAVPELIEQCAARSIPAALIISAGFREVGKQGADLEKQILQSTQGGRIRIIGPNCLGVMSPISGLNATFAAGMARQGNVAFISQSGALCTAVLDWSFTELVGFSAFLSIGSMLDVNWGDLIAYLGDDPHTHSIVIYMETIGDARSFLSAAREVALTKPIIVIKAGRTEAAAKAASSHTGALAGSDLVLDAALRRCGVLRVNTIAEMFAMAEVLGKQARPKGPRLTILTNAGGPGVLATDALIAAGGQLSPLTDEIKSALDKVLPAHWSRSNPIDILGDADPERYAQALEIAVKDPHSDGLLVILTPQAMTDPARTAEHLRPLAQGSDKPILASWMGGPAVAGGTAILDRANVPTFAYPDTAAQVFQFMWRYTESLRALYETPEFVPREDEDERHRGRGAETIFSTARAAGRTLLTELESKQLLAAYRIPTVESRWARDENTAVELAREIGYPVAVKLHSETITHKTEVGGVRLDLHHDDAVRQAFQSICRSVSELHQPTDFLGVTVQPMIAHDGYELILGSRCDSQFGPVLLFGSGGQLVEVYRDRELALPPLNTTLALRMMERTRIFEALRGVRGRPAVDIAELQQLLVRFSWLVVEQPSIQEIDINPLVASPDRLIAVDARVVLHDADKRQEDIPVLAIRPYPSRYVSSWTFRDGSPGTIRPIRPEDEPMMVRFHATLSERSVYFRYFSLFQHSQRVAHDRLSRLCFIDYDRAMALVMDRKNPQTGLHEIIGVGRLTKLPGSKAEFAVLIADPFQGQGLGTELLARLVQIGREEKLRMIQGDILLANQAMQRVAEKLGFTLAPHGDGTIMRAVIQL